MIIRSRNVQNQAIFNDKVSKMPKNPRSRVSDHGLHPFTEDVYLTFQPLTPARAGDTGGLVVDDDPKVS